MHRVGSIGKSSRIFGRICLRQGMVTSGHQNTPREAWTEQGHQPGHPSCHPPTGVTWSRRVMWHQRPLVTITWRRQRDSAENSGTFSNTTDSVCRMFCQKETNLIMEFKYSVQSACRMLALETYHFFISSLLNVLISSPSYQSGCRWWSSSSRDHHSCSDCHIEVRTTIIHYAVQGD